MIRLIQVVCFCTVVVAISADFCFAPSGMGAPIIKIIKAHKIATNMIYPPEGGYPPLDEHTQYALLFAVILEFLWKFLKSDYDVNDRNSTKFEDYYCDAVHRALMFSKDPYHVEEAISVLQEEYFTTIGRMEDRIKKYCPKAKQDDCRYSLLEFFYDVLPYYRRSRRILLKAAELADVFLVNTFEKEAKQHKVIHFLIERGKQELKPVFEHLLEILRLGNIEMEKYGPEMYGLR